MEYYVFSTGDLKEQSKAQLSEGSITLQAEELESISQVDENDVTLTANKGETEVLQAFHEEKLKSHYQ